MSWLPIREHVQQLLDISEVRQVIQYLPHDLQAAADTPEGFVIAIVLTVVLGLLLVLALTSSRRKRSNNIVIAGPVNAGKSSLFFQLRDGSQHNGLVASMQANSGRCSLSNGKPFTAVDIPGHHSFKHLLEEALQTSAGVVFVVDAVEVSPKRTEAAEMLYEVLTHPSFHKQRVPLLIACNKADLEEEAHSVEFIKKTLEKQLDSLRKTKAAGIGKDAATQSTVLGPPEKPFSLGALRSKVVVAECSAAAGQLANVQAFIASCV